MNTPSNLTSVGRRPKADLPKLHRFLGSGGVAFMVFLTAVTIFPIFLGGADIPSGLITLICFLPMVIYFSERSATEKISQLEARIVELEKVNKLLVATGDNVSS